MHIFVQNGHAQNVQKSLHIYSHTYFQVLSSEGIIADVVTPEILHSVRDVVQNPKFTIAKTDTLASTLSKTPSKVDTFS